MRKLTTKEFIAKAKAVHGDKYDYSKVVYANNYTKVCIICHEHGEFMQRPNDHFNGHGCPKCAREGQKSLILNVGNNDLLDTRKTHYYCTWISMLSRCYDNRLQNLKWKTYIGCSVCDEWLTLSNFKLWYEDPNNGYQEGYHLDKDILLKGNKVYSPDTCCFVPTEINSLFTKTDSLRGRYPIGVIATPHNKFVAKLSGQRIYLGVFDTPELAFLAYKNAKEQQIKELAEKYFKEGKITERVYDALMKYEVEITD